MPDQMLCRGSFMKIEDYAGVCLQLLSCVGGEQVACSSGVAACTADGTLLDAQA